MVYGTVRNPNVYSTTAVHSCCPLRHPPGINCRLAQLTTVQRLIQYGTAHIWNFFGEVYSLKDHGHTGRD
jgi:hypothetical protein